MSSPSITSSSIQELAFFCHFNMASNIYHDPNYTSFWIVWPSMAHVPRILWSSWPIPDLTKNSCFSDLMKISNWPSILPLTGNFSHKNWNPSMDFRCFVCTDTEGGPQWDNVVHTFVNRCHSISLVCSVEPFWGLAFRSRRHLGASWTWFCTASWEKKNYRKK